MKATAPAPAQSAKRRWKGFASAVLALVLFSLLVPLAFLLGLHNRFPSGYLTDEHQAAASNIPSYGEVGRIQEENSPERKQSRIVNDLTRRFGPGSSKEIANHTVDSGQRFETKHLSIHDGGVPSHEDHVSPSTSHPALNKRKDETRREVKGTASAKESTGDEIVKPCQLQFGSYCLWSIEHKEALKDSIVKTLKDQLFVARAYFPSIAKLKSQEIFSREVKQNIQEHERMLSEAIVDADLPAFAAKKIRRMEETIAKAKSFHVECNNVDKKLRQILDLTEDEAFFHRRQSAFLYHLGVQTMPKGLHCLSMRLTVEQFQQPSSEREVLHADKVTNPDLHHYIIFSRNILASSVAINSTVMNAKDSKRLVFHIITDEQNYFAMKFWFSRNLYKEAVISILNIEDPNTNNSHNTKLSPISSSEEFRISFPNGNEPSQEMRTEYISVFSHSHFLIADLFKNLKKVVILDDDVVVQKDLSPLWSLNMEGKVNGAVHFCRVRLNQLKSYLGSSPLHSDSCAWMSGLNIVDLEKWREHDITGTYQRLLQEVQRRSKTSWRAAMLPVSLLAFQNLTYSFNDFWVLSGLGKDYGISTNDISKAPVLHYNGNMKPWLELGIPNYKVYWRKFLPKGNQFIDDCNANP